MPGSRTCFENAVLLDPERPRPVPGGLLVEGGRIAAILGSPAEPVGDAHRVDCRGQSLAPGLIDLHYHGRFAFTSGEELDDAVHDAYRHAGLMVRHGITAYLPTTVALPETELAGLVTSMTRLGERGDAGGARPLGLHLEGPWISADAAGAQPSGGIRPCRLSEARDLIARAAGRLRMVTLAPECEGAGALIELLAAEGVVASLGHSRASAACAEEAIARGARHVTHLFNGMAPLHHRAPGLLGVALVDERLSADLICDGVHVDGRVVRLAARALGERLVLISDRLEPPERSHAAGPAAFGAGGLHHDGVAWRLADGRLAGSALCLDSALRAAGELAGLSLLEALAACTLRPARLLGMEREIGSLRPGARADLVLLDAERRPRATWIAGRQVYAAGTP